MDKKIKKLWLLLIILIVLIILIILVVLLFKNNNIHSESNSDNGTIIKIENNNWQYFNSYFYNTENIASSIAFDSFTLKFTNLEVEICFKDECDSSSYVIKDNFLTIENLKRFSGNFKISYDNEYMILEEDYSNGSRLVYYFIKSLG